MSGLDGCGAAGRREEGHDFAARGGGFCFRAESEKIRGDRGAGGDQEHIDKMNESEIPESPLAKDARTEEENDGKVR